MVVPRQGVKGVQSLSKWREKLQEFGHISLGVFPLTIMWLSLDLLLLQERLFYVNHYPIMRQEDAMNCPRHIREMADPEAPKKAKEREELEELEELLAGPEEDYIS